MTAAASEAPALIIQRYLREQNLSHVMTGEREWLIWLPAATSRSAQVQLDLADYTLYLSSFFMRGPEENVAEVYRFLLRKNLELRGVAFGLNEAGDIFLRAETRAADLTEEVLDQCLGTMLSAWETAYGTVLRLGWSRYLDQGTPD